MRRITLALLTILVALAARRRSRADHPRRDASGCAIPELGVGDVGWQKGWTVFDGARARAGTSATRRRTVVGVERAVAGRRHGRRAREHRAARRALHGATAPRSCQADATARHAGARRRARQRGARPPLGVRARRRRDDLLRLPASAAPAQQLGPAKTDADFAFVSATASATRSRATSTSTSCRISARRCTRRPGSPRARTRARGSRARDSSRATASAADSPTVSQLTDNSA